MPVHLKITALEELDADARRLLDAAVDLANAAERLLSIVPPQISPVLIAREHLAELGAARTAFVHAARDVLEVVDPDGLEVLETAEQPGEGKSLLERAGYQDGDLDRTLLEQATNPGAQANR